jgi:hypothetical protein
VRSFFASAIFVLLTSQAGAEEYDLDRIAEIPIEYRGRWNSAGATCNPFDGRYRLEIGAGHIVVGGDRFRADHIWTRENGITVISDYVGPARLWTRVDYFRLTEGGRVLLDDHAGRTVARNSCEG